MRKSVGYTLAAIIVLLLGATGVLYSKYRAKTADYTETKAAEQSSEARYTEAINAIAEIQDSLSTVAIGDSGVRLLSNQLQSEQRLTRTGQHEALERIAVLKAGIERTKARINQLEARLKKSGVKVAGLQRMIAGLKRTVSEREQMVADLSSRVDSLQTRVTGLVAEVQANEDTIRQQSQNIEDKRRELGTVYYVVGNTKELKNAGVVVAKGGVLGVGKTLKPTGNYNEAVFTAIDTDQETVIPTPATKPSKVQVISAQPPSSYQLETVNGKVELHITDAKEFRKVKHVVILAT